MLAESRLFATLDPTSRKKRLPKEAEVIITDTVGFIRELPRELITAFRATLEELEDADLLIHVIDISNPRCEHQVKSVEQIVENLHLDEILVLRVLNKQDLVDPISVRKWTRRLGGIPISAHDEKTLGPLLDRIEWHVRRLKRGVTCHGAQQAVTVIA